MKTIYKYTLSITDIKIFLIPDKFKILHVGLDPNGVPSFWAEVDTTHLAVEVPVFIFGTGNPIDPYAKEYIGTFIKDVFVWHMYI
jgi:hypothetical protein